MLLGYIFKARRFCWDGILLPEPKNIDLDIQLMITWQSFNVPLHSQGIGKTFSNRRSNFTKQLKGLQQWFFEPQKSPEYWQLGAGYKIKDLRLSLQYSRGFSEVHKYTSTGESSWQGVAVMHQEVFVKLEYPLWKF